MVKTRYGYVQHQPYVFTYDVYTSPTAAKFGWRSKRIGEVVKAHGKWIATLDHAPDLSSDPFKTRDYAVDNVKHKIAMRDQEQAKAGAPNG